MKVFIIVLSLFYFQNILAQTSSASEKGFSVVAIGKASAERKNLYLSSIKDARGNVSKQYQWITDIVAQDLDFYRSYFEVAKKENFSEGESGYLVTMTINNSSEMTIVLKDENNNQRKVVTRALRSTVEDRAYAHQLADDIYQSLVGRESIFKSQLFFVCETKRTPLVTVKELFRADFDGHNMKQLTHHKGMVIGPGISFDNKKVVYSLIDFNSSGKRQDVVLYIKNLETAVARVISKKKGINSGAVFMPGDQKILLTLSHRGNADIYEYDLRTKKYRQLTNNWAADVDPSIASHGRMMVFLSDRPKKAEIYTMNPSGLEKNVKRISFVGDYNATPRFSPDGTEIAFSAWMDGKFEIFRIDADGLNVGRLTNGKQSNESPTYSNDGQFIAFSSQTVISRTKAVQKIVIMDRYGKIIGPVSKKYNNCISPRWSK